MKKFLLLILIIFSFSSGTKAYDLYLNFSFHGLCTAVTIFKPNNKVIWQEIFLIPELLKNAPKEDIPDMVHYLSTITHKKIKNKKTVLKYIQKWNRTKNRYSEEKKFKFKSLIICKAMYND